MSKANRDIGKLSRQFQFKVTMFLADPRIKELWVFVTEWFRSKARQKELYAQGRTKPWKIVTWTLESNHMTWDSIDIWFTWKELYPSDVKIWNEVYDIAESYWISSLYREWWKDRPHLNDNWQPYFWFNDNQIDIMDNLLPKQLEAVKSCNSVLWNLVKFSSVWTKETKEELMDKLADVNDFIRKNFTL